MMGEIENKKTKRISNDFDGEEWEFEANESWRDFWDIILKEYIRQHPEEFKELIAKEKSKGRFVKD